jgi:transcriptional regulator with XRE-family HTH domain
VGIKERITEFINSKNFSIKYFEERCGLSNGYISSMRKGFGTKKLDNVLNEFPELNRDWLLYGEGSMLKDENQIKKIKEDTNLIPFYDDVSSIGGINETGANLEAITKPTDYIDTGDWFRDATAAIRHYGESMIEYPPGCILALKEVYDRRLIVPGRDYVVETSEYRVTKQIQLIKDGFITAYSSNQETYADGRLIHAPFDIPLDAIVKISLVLGYVVKKNGGTMIYSNKK